MVKGILAILILELITGCASEDQIKRAIRQDPNIVFDVIEENPEAFIEVVNRAAQKAQASRYQQQEAESKRRQEAEIKNPRQPKIDSSRRLAGDDKGKIVIVEFGDFQCPACGMAYNY